MSLNFACNEATLVTHILEELGIEAKVHAYTDAKSVIDFANEDQAECGTCM